MVLPSAEMARPWFSCEKVLDYVPGEVNNQSPRWMVEVSRGQGRTELAFRTDWVTRVVWEVTLRHVPPLSCKPRTETLPSPFFCSTTRRLPALSNSIDLGDDNPVAISWAR
jgi:hypothetical protein